MNIFSLDFCPIASAQMQCDKHVVKMCTESAQMLSTAHRVLDGTMLVANVNGRKRKLWHHPDLDCDSLLYKVAHLNHPCSIWTRETNNNYNWHYVHWKALCDEYTYRYGKVHKSWRELSHILEYPPANIATGWLKPRPLTIGEQQPDDVSRPVQAYRRFYMDKQKRFKMEWNKGRPRPDWFIQYELN